MKKSTFYLCILALWLPCISNAADITVNSPKGGENWLAGTTQTITWTYTGTDPVKIELLKGGTTVLTLAAKTPNSGSFAWPIISNQTTGNDYKIRISRAEGSPPIDGSSDAYFSITCHCNNPAFLSNDVKPNILIILDNSNSMDEDFSGGAVGSYSPASKSVIARKALQEIVDQLKDKLRIGLITYNVPSATSYELHNALYFASYNPESYCPDAPAACVEFCKTGDSTNEEVCRTSCQQRNPKFNTRYFDEIIDPKTDSDSVKKNKYCSLIYPKTQMKPNQTDTTDPPGFIYTKHAYPFYDTTDQGVGFFYSPDYSVSEGTHDKYTRYGAKKGTEDTETGYLFPYPGEYTISHPTDTDSALGYQDYGQRVSWYHVGKTWFNSGSLGGGYLHVPIDDLSTVSGETTTNTSTYTSLMEKLNPKENDAAGYMSCSESKNKNQCQDTAGKFYIINAGLTPTAGTLQNAIDYFKGTLEGFSSPIQVRCQKNYVIYVTDGLPSVSETGTPGSADELMPDVLEKLGTLQDIKKKFPDPKHPNNSNFDIEYTFNINTYILGIGLSSEAKTKLDTMAVEGGTAVNGDAYYADEPTKLAETLSNIFSDILTQTSSGTSVSILSEKAQQGANMMQAVFYPSKKFGDADQETWLSWTGYLYDYWFYISKTESNLREDSNKNAILDLDTDYGLSYSFDTATEQLSLQRLLDVNGDGSFDDATNYGSPIPLENVAALWEAGDLLSKTSPDSRTIYTVGQPTQNSTEQLVKFKPSELAAFKSNLGNPTTFSNCLRGANDDETAANLVNYVRGTDITGCRGRTFTITEEGVSKTRTWKLGDIAYSTPTVESDYRYCYNENAQKFDIPPTLCTTSAQCNGLICKKKESVVFVGSNDGMLHAFKTGVLSRTGLTGKQVTKLEGTELGEELWAFIPKNVLPYLRCLGNPGYCHLNYVDLSPYLVNMGGKRILIGGMRLGGAGCDATNLSAIKTGAPSDTCSQPFSCTNLDSCYNPSMCIGLSSYFALDVTDAEAPQLLWEFTHPKLGYSYSGPAVIHRKVKPSSAEPVEKHFVMFLSGPTNRNGSSNQNVHAFVLSLDEQLKIQSTNGLYVKDLGETFKNGFGGRLFSDGFDVDEDGFTDFVLFGYSSSNSGKIDEWSGGVVKLWTGDANTADNTTEPRSWEFALQNLNLNQPVTAKVELMKCFNQWFLYAGTGRYFFKNDQYDANTSDLILGVPFLCTAKNNCSTGTINFSHTSAELCGDLSTHAKQMAWRWELERPADTLFYKERSITDPTKSSQNMVFFTTTEPTSDVCGFGGQSRVWGLNCATGNSILDASCPDYTVKNPTGGIYLQTSTGVITRINIDSSNTNENNFNQNDGKSTDWIPGIPPESSPPFVPPYAPKTGKVLLWMEK
ncbi:pilus assembly protein [Desulforhabdus sp. TSK]|uniref:pilus assembly protein n=1 Tax=Desulforhabdus sp. TSK TaxID=2925014 RepID=UPI001FC8D895|nr:Ser-Thr-rich GPI-anchored membrane family protein [Desulforhabdus sp. TSK]GKT08979.1 hypothetical protein DSTSK_22840 [Desulforhabdus sp. TSK]